MTGVLGSERSISAVAERPRDIMTIASCAFHTWIRRPRYGGPCRNIAMTFDTKKTRMFWLPDGEKYSSILYRFSVIW